MIPLLLLIASIVLLRIAPWVAGGEVLKAVAGYAPVMALAVCSGSFLSRRAAWLVALVAAVVPHFVINLSHGSWGDSFLHRVVLPAEQHGFFLFRGWVCADFGWVVAVSDDWVAGICATDLGVWSPAACG